MNELQVKMIELPALRALCFNGFGESPEEAALNKLQVWAQANGQAGRIFGYNNPNPAAGSPNYGYDVWMVVDGSVQAESEARVIDFAGGLYAVARCHVNQPGEDIPATWQALVRWRENSPYQEASHQWLEEHIQPADAPEGTLFSLDLYLPVRK